MSLLHCLKYYFIFLFGFSISVRASYQVNKHIFELSGTGLEFNRFQETIPGPVNYISNSRKHKLKALYY